MTDRERLAIALDALGRLQQFNIIDENISSLERSAYSMQAIAAEAMFKITMK